MIKYTVKLCNYNPNWEKQFEYEKHRILNILGDRVIGIEHIGSTSIKNLKAKPIIDIMVGVQEIDDVNNLVNPLSEIDYEYVLKPELKNRKFFRKGLWGQGTCHLHICELNSEEWIDKLLFRDYLRLHPKIAVEYTLLKEELAFKYQRDRRSYTRKKEPFIKAIIEKARKELGSK